MRKLILIIAVICFSLSSFSQTNLIVNGGYAPATDWLNPTDGLAEFWSTSAPLQNAFSIETGGGFIGNSQRDARTSGTTAGIWINQFLDLHSAADRYYCYLIYTSSSPIKVFTMYTETTGGGTMITAPAASTPTVLGGTINFIGEYLWGINISMSPPTAGGIDSLWFQIDSVYFSTTAPPANLATVITNAATNVGSTTATANGEVTANNGAIVTERGFAYSSSTLTPDIISDSKITSGSGLSVFSSDLTSLTPSDQYWVRAYATNSVGTSYGATVSFTTTAPSLPTVITTTPITSITDITATGGGNVTSDGGASVTARGICWDTSINPNIVGGELTTDGTGTGSFISSLTDLSASTTYYVRAYATNSVGTSYGDNVSFTTSLGGISWNGVTITKLNGVTVDKINGL
jgi:hypothetical protein